MYGPLHQQRLGTIPRHEANPCRNGIGRVAKTHRVAVNRDLSCARFTVSTQHVEEFVLSLPFESHDAKNFALKQIKRNVRKPRTGTETIHAQPRHKTISLLIVERLSCACGSDLATKHQFNRTILDTGLNLQITDGFTIPQNTRAVADFGNLGKAV